MFGFGYSQNVGYGAGFTPRGNRFFMNQPMTPGRGRSPFSNVHLMNRGNSVQNGFVLPSRSLQNSQNSGQVFYDSTPQRPLTRSNVLQVNPPVQNYPTQFYPQANFIQQAEISHNERPKKSNINELYKKAMNRTNETLNRVKQKENRINMVLNRNHLSRSPNQNYTKPFSNNITISEPSPIKVEIETKPQANNVKSPSKAYIKKEFKDGYYEGESFGGVREGFGVLKDLSNQIIYTGYWKSDTFHGKGKAYNQSVTENSLEFHKNFDKVKNCWIWYEGEFKEGMFHGYGTLQLSNGDKFSGYFENNKANGSGNYTFSNGELIVGVWENNKLETTF